MSSRADAGSHGRVTAVLVSHDGEPWIPTLVRALEASTVKPDRTVCVDTGSTDASRALLSRRFGPVVEASERTGFGAAVALGLAATEQDGGAHRSDDDWIWLLHDDCAPAAEALAHQLSTAASDPTIAVVGCRVRAWPRARRLLEVGVSITGTGHRETGLEPGEYDQGQHDGVRTVLAVSSAGMLVRRTAWDLLGGFDSRLPLFRDDVDFGWRVAGAGMRVVVCPDAVMFHAEASTRGVRDIANTAASPHRADRQAALFTLLANGGSLTLPWQYARACVGSVLRACGYLVGKLPSTAYDEMVAMLSVVLRPDRIAVARSRRRTVTRVGARQVRRLFPPWWTPYLNGLDAVMSRRAGTVRETATAVGSSTRQWRSDRGASSSLDSGPVSDEALDPATGSSPPSWLRSHVLVSLLAVLGVAALAASRGLLLGGGALQGGGLLPAPGAALEWWRLYGETHHAVALGSGLATAPYVVGLGLAGALLLGNAEVTVRVLMLLAVPVAALGAYAAARQLVRSVSVRVWMASTYALVPVLIGAVTTGRVGTVAACIAVPWLVPAALPMFARTRVQAWRPAFAGGLVLAVTAAFAPVAWLMAAALLAVSLPMVAVGWGARTVARAAVLVALPLALLAPWSIRLAADPRALLIEAGLVDPTTPPVAGAAWQLPFGRLAAAGAAPWWFGAGVLVASLVAVMRRSSRAGVSAAWLVLAVALATAAALSHLRVSVPGTDQQAFVWLGFPVVVAQGAAVVAVGLAADGFVASITTGSFGFRQPIAAVVGGLALVSPVLGVAWWVVVAPHGELSRSAGTELPVYLADTLASDESQRALVLRREGAQVSYGLIVGDGLRLGDDSVLPAREPAMLTGLVADILSQGKPEDLTRLADLGVSYVVMPAPVSADDVAALDGLAGLTRASTDAPKIVAWQIEAGHLPRPGSGAADGAIEATSPGQPAVASANRGWWLAGQTAAWFVAVVLASPSLVRAHGLPRVGR